MKQPRPRPPGRPRVSQQEKPVKDKILLTASDLFMQRGFERVSMNEVAVACGVTKASVYYYFPNKSDLFTEAVTALMERVTAHTTQHLRKPLPLAERLQLIAEAYLMTPHAYFESVLHEAEPKLTEEQLQQIRSAESCVHEALAAELARAMEAGEIASGKPIFIAEVFVAMLMVGSRHGVNADQAAATAREIVALLWSGIAPRHE